MPTDGGNLRQVLASSGKFEVLVKLTSCYTKSSEEVVYDSEQGSLEVQMHPPSLDQTIKRDANDQRDVQPVHVFVPVGFGDGSIGDMLLLGVVRLASVRFRCLGHW